MPKSPLTRIIKPGSIKNRRRGLKSWRTRAGNQEQLAASAARYADIKNEPAVITERQVRRTANQFWYAHEKPSNSELKQVEIIDFVTAAWEVSGRFSREKFAALLDAGEVVSTRKAFYQLESSETIETTKGAAITRSLEETSQIITLSMQTR